jgi:preprotein translocase subunit SecD
VAPSTTTSRPGRLLATLAVLIVVLLLGVLGGSLAQPANWHKRFKVHLGLDLSSGTTVTLKALPPKGTTATQLAADMSTAESIMNSRVNGAGFNGASVTTEGTNLINVTVPGKGSSQVVSLVGTTAALRFRQVLLVADNYASTSTKKLSTTADGDGDAGALSATVKAQFDKLNCANKYWKAQIYGSNPNNTERTYDNPGIQTVTCYNGLKYALGKAVVTGSELKQGGSSAALQSSGDWWVNLTFDAAGAKAFGNFTSKLYSEYAGSTTNPLNLFAIVLDGVPVSIPDVAGAIPNGSGQIQGTFTESQADTLVNYLNYGALPLTFTPESQQTISAQLGSFQLTAGLLAGAAGLFLVVVYAFLYYRGLGIVAISSLAIAALLSYLGVVLLSLYEGFAMDLAGIAGLIVAIGITADSFVVFFERLRDEVREGKSLRTAVERGWQRARRTILVSDTVSFIAAAVLYKIAVSDVQNFAFTLGLTTLIDVIVVFLFTKPMITLLARTRFYGGGHRLSGLDPARLGARSPWRGSRRPVTRPQATEAPGGAVSATPPRTSPNRANPKEA